MALQATESSPGPLSPPTSPTPDKGKRPAYQNRSWVRGRDPEPMDGSPDGSETGRPSLLSRLGSSEPSLLKRIAPSKEAASEPILATRITNPVVEDEGEESYDEDMDTREEKPPPSNDSIRIKSEESVGTLPPSPTAQRPRWKSGGSRPTIDVFGEPTWAAATSKSPEPPGDAMTTEDEEWSPTPEPTVVDETEVDALLADILSPSRPSSAAPKQHRIATPRVEDTRPDLQTDSMDATPSTPVPSTAEARPPTSSTSSGNVLDKCRDLLIPAIMRFAKRRRPDVDEQSAKHRFVARLSDDRTAELVKLARQVRTQMEEQQRMARKRGWDEELDSGDTGQPLRKLPRKDSTGAEDKEVDVQPDVTMRSSTPTMPYGDTASVASQGESGVAAPATDVQPSFEARLAELRNRSNTPLSAPPPAYSPSSIARTQHSSISLAAHVHSELRQSVHSTSENLLNSRSPVMSERTLSASLLPTPLASATPLLPHPRAQSLASAQTQDTLRSSSLNLSHRDLVTLPPGNIKNPLVAHDLPQDAMQEYQHGQAQTTEQEPSTLVPALWSADHGISSAGVKNVEFYVDNATSLATKHWTCRKNKFRFSFEERYVRVHLLCLPAASVTTAYANLPTNASREDIVAALWNIKSEWPSPGTLVVQTDVDCPESPWTPAQGSGPLDVTAAITHGLNKFRLIQLADMSSKLFVFHAAEPTEEECRAVGEETIGWSRALTKLSLHTSKSPRE